MEKNENNVKLITQEGYDDLLNELNYLKTVERPAIRERIKVARGFGDLSENAEYDAAREEQSKTEGRILEIEEILKISKIYDKSSDNLEGVKMGSKVKVLDIEFDEEMVLTIKGSTETNPKKSIISIESPLGKGLLGHKVGEKVTIEAPAGKIEYKILAIED